MSSAGPVGCHIIHAHLGLTSSSFPLGKTSSHGQAQGPSPGNPGPTCPPAPRVYRPGICYKVSPRPQATQAPLDPQPPNPGAHRPGLGDLGPTRLPSPRAHGPSTHRKQANGPRCCWISHPQSSQTRHLPCKRAWGPGPGDPGPVRTPNASGLRPQHLPRNHATTRYFFTSVNSHDIYTRTHFFPLCFLPQRSMFQNYSKIITTFPAVTTQQNL